MHPSKDSHFASDQNHAEIAELVTLRGGQVTNKLQGALKNLLTEQPTSVSKLKEYFRREAKIWGLYLDEAERVAKERVALWQTWLDSLLIFAGLFAGVVASFVVDATDDSISSSSTSTRSLIITGLWCFSLVITIFGAIMGVLAKAWISNFIPLSNQRGAEDALQRLQLDKQAERWHLDRVIMLIPLLIQIASFLFVLGFAMKLFDASAGIATAVAILVGTGVLIYLSSSVTALMLRSFPFRTPLSEMLSFLLNTLRDLFKRKDADNSIRDVNEDEVNDQMARIWLDNLIKSRNMSTANEAISELSRQWNDMPVERRDFFCEPGVLHILLRQLKAYMKPGSFNSEGREHLCLHLECLMQLVNHIEPKLKSYSSLQYIFAQYIELGGPLHRWNVFQEDIRPLAFSTRMHTTIVLHRMSAKLDRINRDLIEEQSWESLFPNVEGNHRFNFIISSFRGIQEGDIDMQTASLHALSLSLAQAGIKVYSSEPSATVNASMLAICNGHILSYLATMAKRLIERWKAALFEQELQGLDITLGNTNESQNVPSTAKISSLLLHREAILRIHGIQNLGDIRIPFHAWSTEKLIKYFQLETIAKIIVNDEDKSVSNNALKFMVTLLEKDKDHVLKQEIESLIAKHVRQKLDSEESDEDCRASVMTPLLDINEIDSEILDVSEIIKDSINTLVEMAFIGQLVETRHNGAKLVIRLLKNNKFCTKATESIRKFFLIPFDDKDWSDWSTYINAFNTILFFLEEFEHLRTFIDIYVKKFIIDCALYDGFELSRRRITRAQTWLKRCSRNKLHNLAAREESSSTEFIHFQSVYDHNVERLFNLTTEGVAGTVAEKWNDTIHSQDWNSRLNSDISSADWMKQSIAMEFCQDVMHVPILISMIVTNEEFGGIALRSLRMIVNSHDVELQPMSSNFLSLFDTLLSESSSYQIKLECIDIIGSLFKRIEFPVGIQRMIRGIINNSLDEEIRTKIVEILCKLITANFPTEFITPSDTLSLSLKVMDDSWIMGLRWLELWTSLKRSLPYIKEAVLSVLSPVMEEFKLLKCNHEQLINHGQWNTTDFTLPATDHESIIWIRLMGFLAIYFQDEVKDIVHSIIRMAYDRRHEKVRLAAIQALTLLARTEGFHDLTVEYFLKCSDDYLGPRDELHLRIKTYEFFALSGEHAFLQNILQIATDSGSRCNKYARCQAMQSLVALSKIDEKVELQNKMKLALDNVILTKDPELEVLVECVEFCTSMAKKRSQNAFSWLIDVAHNQSDYDACLKAIRSLTYLAKTDESLRELLINRIKLNCGPDVRYDIVVAWENLLTVVPVKDRSLSITPMSIKTCVTHFDEEMKSVLLHIILTHGSFNTMDSLLPKEIEMGLKSREDNVLPAVISTVELTVSNLNPKKYSFGAIHSIIKSAIPLLLEISMNEEDFYLQEFGEKALINIFDQLPKSDSPDYHLFCYLVVWPLLSAIPKYMPSITRNGKKFLMQWAKSLVLMNCEIIRGRGLVSSIIKKLSLLLKTSHTRLAHMTVLEFLAVLFSDSLQLEMSSEDAENVLSNIIAFALNSTDDEKLVILALKTAVLFCTNKMPLITKDSFLLVSNNYEKHLMPLLESKIVQVSYAAAEILSLMAGDMNVRKDILSQIILRGTSQDTTKVVLEGHLILLLRLILDERLCEEPMDFVAMFLAFTLVQRPHLIHLRFALTSGLWRNYRVKINDILKNEKAQEELLKWAQLALFGRHMTSPEVKTWNDMNDQWLRSRESDETIPASSTDVEPL